MNVIGLDLGTTTGWAVHANGRVHLGKWKLATAQQITAQRRTGVDRDQDIRIPRLFEYVKAAVDFYEIDLIVFEDVKFVRTAAQGQLWASLRSCVWLQTGLDGQLREVKIKAVPVQTLKKFATGRGDASKDSMIRMAFKHYPDECKKLGKVFDDNIADALHLMRYGLESTI